MPSFPKKRTNLASVSSFVFNRLSELSVDELIKIANIPQDNLIALAKTNPERRANVAALSKETLSRMTKDSIAESREIPLPEVVSIRRNQDITMTQRLVDGEAVRKYAFGGANDMLHWMLPRFIGEYIRVVRMPSGKQRFNRFIATRRKLFASIEDNLDRFHAGVTEPIQAFSKANQTIKNRYLEPVGDKPAKKPNSRIPLQTKSQKEAVRDFSSRNDTRAVTRLKRFVHRTILQSAVMLMRNILFPYGRSLQVTNMLSFLGEELSTPILSPQSLINGRNYPVRDAKGSFVLGNRDSDEEILLNVASKYAEDFDAVRDIMARESGTADKVMSSYLAVIGGMHEGLVLAASGMKDLKITVNKLDSLILAESIMIGVEDEIVADTRWRLEAGLTVPVDVIYGAARRGARDGLIGIYGAKAILAAGLIPESVRSFCIDMVKESKQLAATAGQVYESIFDVNSFRKDDKPLRERFTVDSFLDGSAHLAFSKTSEDRLFRLAHAIASGSHHCLDVIIPARASYVRAVPRYLQDITRVAIQETNFILSGMLGNPNVRRSMGGLVRVLMRRATPNINSVASFRSFIKSSLERYWEKELRNSVRRALSAGLQGVSDA